MSLSSLNVWVLIGDFRYRERRGAVRCYTTLLVECFLAQQATAIAIVRSAKQGSAGEAQQHNKLDSASGGLIMEKPHISR